MIEEIKARLRVLGVSPRLKGYEYLARAIELLAEQKQSFKITELYSYIGSEYSTTGSRVERAIRTAVQHTIRNPEAAQMFDTILCYEKAKPTNSDFLFLLADEFKKKPEEHKESKYDYLAEAIKPIEENGIHGLIQPEQGKKEDHVKASIVQYLENDNNRLDKLIEAFPVSMPTSAAAEFLGIDVASMRAAIENGAIGLAWRKQGKTNHAYYIPTAQFVRWYLNMKI